MIKVKVTGQRDLERSLASLEKTASRKTAARNALKKAAVPMRDKAAALAPDDPATSGEDLRHSIAIGTRLTKRQKKLQRRAIGTDRETVTVFVGVNENANAYGHLQEFGSTLHRPQPFMRPAWASTQRGVLASITKHLKATIAKASARAARAARAALRKG